MSSLRKNLLAVASMLALAGGVQAQSDTRSEMDRGVPGVDVDTGRNASGAVDVDRAGNETSRGVPGVDADVGRNADGAVDMNAGRAEDDRSRGVPGVDVDAGRNASGAMDIDRERAPRADRN